MPIRSEALAFRTSCADVTRTVIVFVDPTPIAVKTSLYFQKRPQQVEPTLVVDSMLGRTLNTGPVLPVSAMDSPRSDPGIVDSAANPTGPRSRTSSSREPHGEASIPLRPEASRLNNRNDDNLSINIDRIIPDRNDIFSSSQQSHNAADDPVERSCYLYTNVATRGPIFNITLSGAEDNSDLPYLFRATSTTSQDLIEWHHCQYDDGIVGWRNSFPGAVICNIVHNDTEDFFQIVEWFLDKIAVLSTDDAIVQRRLLQWRNLLEILDQELRYYEASIPRLAKFLTSRSAWNSDSQHIQTGDIYDIEGVLLPHIRSRISQTQTRLRISLQALVASVSILESRRGIAEAETVTRLTELGKTTQITLIVGMTAYFFLTAFFFIPISFAATFFGMQVKELSHANTSIWVFFLLAFTISVSSYGLRLLIQSPHFLFVLQWCKYAVREDAGIRQDQQIRTSFFLRWIWHQTSGGVVLLVWLLITLCPLIGIWKSGLIHTVKLVISLVVVLLSIAVLILIQFQTDFDFFTLPNLERSAKSFARWASSTMETARPAVSGEA